MSVGIPWAFYIKPLILKRRRNKLKAAHQRSAASPGGTGFQPVNPPSAEDSHEQPATSPIGART